MGSPFASRTAVTLPITFDPGQEVTLQKLAGRHLEKAELAAQAKFIDSVEARGGFDAQKQMLKMYEDGKPKGEPEPKAETDKKPENPLAGLDAYTVCRFGIRSWTYPESLEAEASTQRIACLDDMDSDSLDWFATEIMRLTKPRLFQTKAEHKESEKNDSAPSPTA